MSACQSKAHGAVSGGCRWLLVGTQVIFSLLVGTNTAGLPYSGATLQRGSEAATRMDHYSVPWLPVHITVVDGCQRFIDCWTGVGVTVCLPPHVLHTSYARTIRGVLDQEVEQNVRRYHAEKVKRHHDQVPQNKSRRLPVPRLCDCASVRENGAIHLFLA